MAHFDEVLDLGYDYGADGGLGWETQVIAFPSGQTRRNQVRENAIGRWQLGNRNVNAAQADAIAGFFHAMRGRLHSFLYRDWNDYRAVDQQLLVTGSDVQLIKAYGLSINGWIREIKKPKPGTVVLEANEGAGWVELEAGVDYTLNPSTGVVTLLIGLESVAQLRWSGEFYVPVRFDRDVLDLQFLAYEHRGGAAERAYSLGALAVVEEPDPEPVNA